MTDDPAEVVKIIKKAHVDNGFERTTTPPTPPTPAAPDPRLRPGVRGRACGWGPQGGRMPVARRAEGSAVGRLVECLSYC